MPLLTSLLALDPVWLDAAPLPEAASDVSSGFDWVGGWAVVITANLVLAACYFAFRLLRRRKHVDPLAAAQDRLARRMRLPRASRNAILALSDSSGIPAAAMLVSRGAFTAALANADTQKTTDARAIAPRVMQSLFAELSPPTNAANPTPQAAQLLADLSRRFTRK